MKKILLYGNFSGNMLRALEAKCPQGFQLEHQLAGCDLSLLADADYIINRGGVIDADVIRAARNTKLIQKWGVGYDKIDIKTAGAHGIPVAICAGGNAMPVAELAVTLMLDVLRGVVPMSACLKQGDWARDRFSPKAYLLHGKTVGLVGIGNIARKVAAIVRGGFDCQVLYYDVCRLSREQEQELGVSYARLEELMAQADIVSIHVPLLDSTAGMINKSNLSLMKPTACIINTSRGGVIHEQDLIQALKNQQILGAGLDTYAMEPLPADSPLLAMEQVVTTPHCGGNTVDNDINMAGICMENIAQYDAAGDRAMRAIVNQDYLN